MHRHVTTIENVEEILSLRTQGNPSIVVSFPERKPTLNIVFIKPNSSLVKYECLPADSYEPEKFSQLFETDRCRFFACLRFHGAQTPLIPKSGIPRFDLINQIQTMPDIFQYLFKFESVLHALEFQDIMKLYQSNDMQMDIINCMNLYITHCKGKNDFSLFETKLKNHLDSIENDKDKENLLKEISKEIITKQQKENLLSFTVILQIIISDHQFEITKTRDYIFVDFIKDKMNEITGNLTNKTYFAGLICRFMSSDYRVIVDMLKDNLISKFIEEHATEEQKSLIKDKQKQMKDLARKLSLHSLFLFCLIEKLKPIDPILKSYLSSLKSEKKVLSQILNEVDNNREIFYPHAHDIIPYIECIAGIEIHKDPKEILESISQFISSENLTLNRIEDFIKPFDLPTKLVILSQTDNNLLFVATLLSFQIDDENIKYFAQEILNYFLESIHLFNDRQIQQIKDFFEKISSKLEIDLFTLAETSLHHQFKTLIEKPAEARLPSREKLKMLLGDSLFERIESDIFPSISNIINQAQHLSDHHFHTYQTQIVHALQSLTKNKKIYDDLIKQTRDRISQEDREACEEALISLGSYESLPNDDSFCALVKKVEKLYDDTTRERMSTQFFLVSFSSSIATPIFFHIKSNPFSISPNDIDHILNIIKIEPNKKNVIKEKIVKSVKDGAKSKLKTLIISLNHENNITDKDYNELLSIYKIYQNFNLLDVFENDKYELLFEVKSPNFEDLFKIFQTTEINSNTNIKPLTCLEGQDLRKFNCPNLFSRGDLTFNRSILHFKVFERMMEQHIKIPQSNKIYYPKINDDKKLQVLVENEFFDEIIDYFLENQTLYERSEYIIFEPYAETILDFLMGRIIGEEPHDILALLNFSIDPNSNLGRIFLNSESCKNQINFYIKLQEKIISNSNIVKSHTKKPMHFTWDALNIECKKIGCIAYTPTQTLNINSTTGRFFTKNSENILTFSQNNENNTSLEENKILDDVSIFSI